MFKRKRSSLIKKLWKFRKSFQPNGSNLDSASSVQNSSSVEENKSQENFEDHFEDDLKSVVSSLLKRLKDHQLETLLRSLESRGGVETDCILFASEQIVLGKRIVSPVLKFCQFFRFPELICSKSLKSLLCCHHGFRYGDFKCANPFHYSRIISDDPPPPPYTPDADELQTDIHTYPLEIQHNNVALLHTQADTEIEDYNRPPSESSLLPKPVHRSLSTSCSFATNLLDKSRCKTWPPRSESSSDSWCKLAYWELRARVGRLFEVNQISCNVFWELPQGDGFCLGLIEYLDPTPDVVERVRRHIGYGFQLTLEDDGIWIYNRSDYALFAGSPSIQLEALNPKTPLVKRVPPGHSLKVFDYMKIKDLRDLREAYSNVDGPCDLYNVRVSFAKGWGRNYTRRFITSCPSWVEIFINEKFVAKL